MNGGYVAFVREDGLLCHSRGGWTVGRRGVQLEIWTADRGAIPFDRVIGCYRTAEEAHADHPRARMAADAYGDARGLPHPYPLFPSKFETGTSAIPRYEKPTRPVADAIFFRPMDARTFEFCTRRLIWFREYFDGVAKGYPITRELIGRLVYDFVGRFKAQWRDAEVSVSAKVAQDQVLLYRR